MSGKLFMLVNCCSVAKTHIGSEAAIIDFTCLSARLFPHTCALLEPDHFYKEHSRERLNLQLMGFLSTDKVVYLIVVAWQVTIGLCIFITPPQIFSSSKGFCWWLSSNHCLSVLGVLLLSGIVSLELACDFTSMECCRLLKLYKCSLLPMSLMISKVIAK